MTNRYMGLTVVLDKDYRSDDAESIIEAIKMIKGVGTVTPVVAEGSDCINRMHIALEIEKKLLAVLHEEFNRRK